MTTQRSGGQHLPVHLALIAALLTVTACSSDEPDATAPLPTQSPTTDATVPTDSVNAPPPTDITSEPTTPATESSAPESTEPPSTDATTTEPGRTRRLPDDLGPMVDEIPYDDVPGLPVPGEIIEIAEMSYLYIPDTVDTSEPSDRDVRPPADDELEIIAAYGRAIAALNSQDTTFPVPIEPNEQMQAAFVDGGQAYSEGAFLARNQEGTYVGFPFDRPDVYRPYVLTEPRSDTEAIIWDCYFLSSAVVNQDGTVARPEAVPYAKAGSEVRLVRVGGTWLVDTIVQKETACG